MIHKRHGENKDESEGGGVSDSDAGREVSCDLGSPASVI